MDYYVITAVSEEGNVICYATTEELTYNCSVPQGSSANDYNFTVHSVTRGIDESSLYNGSITSDCCKSALLYIDNEIFFSNRFTISRECCS